MRANIDKEYIGSERHRLVSSSCVVFSSLDLIGLVGQFNAIRSDGVGIRKINRCTIDMVKMCRVSTEATYTGDSVWSKSVVAIDKGLTILAPRRLDIKFSCKIDERRR